MSKRSTKTTQHGERRIGERAGHASLVLGLLALTFLNSQTGVLGLPRHTMIVIIGGLVLLLGLISRSKGYHTGGGTGIILGLLIFYFTFVAQHVQRLGGYLKIRDVNLVPYLLILLTLLAIVYVIYRPRSVWRRRNRSTTTTATDGTN